MKLKITKAINDVLEKRFVELLAEPELACVNYKKEQRWISYNLYDYSLNWARFARIVDIQVKKTIDSQLGVFTRKHSVKVLDEIRAIANQVTASDVVNQVERFGTWMD